MKSSINCGKTLTVADFYDTLQTLYATFDDVRYPSMRIQGSFGTIASEEDLWNFRHCDLPVHSQSSLTTVCNNDNLYATLRAAPHPLKAAHIAKAGQLMSAFGLAGLISSILSAEAVLWGAGLAYSLGLSAYGALASKRELCRALILETNSRRTYTYREKPLMEIRDKEHTRAVRLNSDYENRERNRIYIAEHNKLVDAINQQFTCTP